MNARERRLSEKNGAEFGVWSSLLTPEVMTTTTTVPSVKSDIGEQEFMGMCVLVSILTSVGSPVDDHDHFQLLFLRYHAPVQVEERRQLAPAVLLQGQGAVLPGRLWGEQTVVTFCI